VISSISPISTKLTINSHLNSLNTKNTTTYDIENLSPGLGQAQNCGRVKPVNPSLLVEVNSFNMCEKLFFVFFMIWVENCRN
jgi:hypothetical protein